MKIKIVLLFAAAVLTGCATQNYIVTTAQSVLGISVSENPATQLYEARAGIVLSQIAFVPCGTNTAGIAPDVLQEFRVNNLFAGGLVYQRLAVGSTAVNQPGASFMFAKDAHGGVNTNFLNAVIQNFQVSKPKP
jgi:hypothetical protein